MRTTSRLGIFVAALGVVFAGGFAAGAATDSDDDDERGPATTIASSGADPAPATTGAGHAAHGGSAPDTTSQP